MASIDTSKLHALVDKHAGHDAPDDGADKEAPHPADDQPGHEEDVSEEAQTQRKMDPKVGYMELAEEAGTFSCENCGFLQPGEAEDTATCINAAVRATVSPTNGCCNLFDPLSDVKVVFPPGKGGDDEAEDDSSDESEEDEETDEADADEGDEDHEPGGFGEE